MKRKSKPKDTKETTEASSFHPSSFILHNSAELLGAVLVDLFPGTELVECVATEQGFYCDFIAEQPVDEQALILLEEKLRGLIKENVEVRAIDMMKENAAQYLEHKDQHIRADEVRRLKVNIVTMFQLGDFCDYCPQPYISGTGEVGVIKLYQIESLEHYFPDEGLVHIKRIHGTASLDKMALKKQTKVREAAKKWDFRQIAKELQLFYRLDTISDRSCVWLPAGTVLKQTLIDWWTKEHKAQGFQAVSTPTLIKEELILKSGVYDQIPHHAEPPFMSIDGVDYVVPPTFAPSHAALFRARQHSYREMPVRYAEFGQVAPLVKSERLRGMHPSDLITADYANIFCNFEELEGELISSLQFIDKIIKMFGFESYWNFVGRDHKFAGTVKQWEKATEKFVQAFTKSGINYATADHELAFAGPAAEVQVIDSFGREWKGPQIALDFSLPERFGLRYQGADNEMHMPLMLTRSVFGSIERLVALLLEHFNGLLPLWMAPEQVKVLPVKEGNNAYAAKVGNLLTEAGFRVCVNCKNDPLGKKIHEAECEKSPYVVVVGEKEEQNNQLTLRSCDDEAQLQTMSPEELIRKLSGEVASKALRKALKNAK